MNKLRYFILGIFLQLCFIINISGQTITGTVISEIYGPIAGVFVSIPKTNISTKTDYKGNYSITIDSNYNTLKFSISGYESKLVNVNKDTVINITLENSPIELNEIIIAGISVSKRENFQGKLIKRNGLFKKDTLIIGIPDSTFNRIERERTNKILDSINIDYINDSLNIINNLKPFEKDFRRYIIDTLEYPQTALNNGNFGRVYVRFTINEESKISDITILKGYIPELNNTVVSILENTPERILKKFGDYGKYKNKQIPVKYMFSIKFVIIEIK